MLTSCPEDVVTATEPHDMKYIQFPVVPALIMISPGRNISECNSDTILDTTSFGTSLKYSTLSMCCFVTNNKISC